MSVPSALCTSVSQNSEMLSSRSILSVSHLGQILCDKRFLDSAFVHRSTLQCIRTMDCEYALCSFFVPGDRQVIVGTKVISVPSALLTAQAQGYVLKMSLRQTYQKCIAFPDLERSVLGAKPSVPVPVLCPESLSSSYGLSWTWTAGEGFGKSQMETRSLTICMWQPSNEAGCSRDR